jgi:hypothetical protein
MLNDSWAGQNTTRVVMPIEEEEEFNEYDLCHPWWRQLHASYVNKLHNTVTWMSMHDSKDTAVNYVKAFPKYQ